MTSSGVSFPTLRVSSADTKSNPNAFLDVKILAVEVSSGAGEVCLVDSSAGIGDDCSDPRVCFSCSDPLPARTLSKLEGGE